MKTQIVRSLVLLIVFCTSAPAAPSEVTALSEPPVGAECVLWVRKDAYAMEELKFIGQIKAVHKTGL